VQCAMLYTTSAGERRVRVLTLGLQATDAMANVFRYADLDATCNVMMRQAVAMTAKQNLHLVREHITTQCVKILHTYRKMVASPSTASGQLVLPESFKLLPLYALSLTKNGLLRPGTDVKADERSSLLAAATRMPITASVAFIYPRLFPVLELSESVGALDADDSPHLPTPLPLVADNLNADGAYLLENAHSLYLWIGKGAPAGWLRAALGTDSLQGADAGALRLPLLENETSVRLARLVNAVRSQRPQLLQMPRIVTPKDSHEARVMSMLTEDRMQTMMNYVEFLCHVHRQIQAKFAN